MLVKYNNSPNAVIQAASIICPGSFSPALSFHFISVLMQADDEVYENQAFSHEESITRHEQVHLQTNGGRRNDRPQSYQTAVKEE